MRERQELFVPAEIGSIEAVTERVDALLEGAGCPIRARMQIDIAIDELFSNIARYAYAGEPGDVRVLAEAGPGEAEITFADTGRPFDPLSREDPDVTLSAEERQVGGLGIFMVKKSMDEVRYARVGDENRLTVVKRW